jgi:acetyl-CoA acyltransferase
MAYAYAAQSQKKAETAMTRGKMKEMIVPIETELADGTQIIADTDQHPRPGTTVEKLAQLKPAFRENGRVTAGNASGLNDGACAALMMSRQKAEALGLQPKMRWVASAVAGVDPRVNKWGGAIAYGHPLAASGPRLVAFLDKLFEETPTARYGLTSLCEGRGQGVSTIWENLR